MFSKPLALQMHFMYHDLFSTNESNTPSILAPFLFLTWQASWSRFHVDFGATFSFILYPAFKLNSFFGSALCISCFWFSNFIFPYFINSAFVIVFLNLSHVLFCWTSLIQFLAILFIATFHHYSHSFNIKLFSAQSVSASYICNRSLFIRATVFIQSATLLRCRCCDFKASNALDTARGRSVDASSRCGTLPHLTVASTACWYSSCGTKWISSL